MKDEIVFLEDKGELLARINCEIDHHSCRALREKIDTALFEKKPKVLALDFSKVNFMDSSGLGLILGRVERAVALGARVEVRGLSASLYKIIRLSGIERIKNLSVKKKEI